jgi:hypothetical protein
MHPPSHHFFQPSPEEYTFVPLPAKAKKRPKKESSGKRDIIQTFRKVAHACMDIHVGDENIIDLSKPAESARNDPLPKAAERDKSNIINLSNDPMPKAAKRSRDIFIPPPLPPALLQISRDLEGADEVELPPSRSYSPNLAEDAYIRLFDNKSKLIRRYDERVQRLVDCMPHLKHLQLCSARMKLGGSITRFEYSTSIENPRSTSRKTFHADAWSGSASRTFAKKLAPKRSGPCHLRVLLVEDIPTDLMRVLGSQYEIDPEAFAAHLFRSGYDSLPCHADLSESRWSTAKIKKSYRSLSWYRPVRLESRVYTWLQTPETLTRLQCDGIKWSETSYERRGKALVERKTKHHVKLNTNTFRQSRPLSTRPFSVPAIWEERATVFISAKKGRPTTSEFLFPRAFADRARYEFKLTGISDCAAGPPSFFHRDRRSRREYVYQRPQNV